MRILKTTLIAISVLLLGSFHNKTSAQGSVSVSFQTFYDELSPYGQWIDYPEYGYVWRPDSYRYNDFHPYRSGGNWAWSEDYGWLWVSDYDWGWAPFHYGRWIYDDWDGWLWVPDYEWGPAWVTWRGGGDYYGWAPMRPGINISINFGSYDLPYNYWSFAPRRYINYPRISNYCMGYDRNTYIFNSTTIINNYDRQQRYFTGPSRYEAERYTRIAPVRIRESQRAGRTIVDRDEVSIYRPYINRGRDNTSPGTFERYDQRNQNRTFDRRSNDGTTRENNIPNNRTGEINDRQNRNTRPYINRGNDRNNNVTQREQRQTPSQENRRIENRNSQVERQQTPDQNNDRTDRTFRNRGNQQTERQQVPGQNNQRVERQQVPRQNQQRIERPYQNRGNQRTERQQSPGQNNQRLERPQVPGQNNQRVERQQVPNQNSQRIERQSNQNSQRVERQSVPNQNTQRVERPYQNRGQQPQLQKQSEQRGNGTGNGNGNGRKRGNN